jgi:hypothetical protein
LKFVFGCFTCYDEFDCERELVDNGNGDYVLDPEDLTITLKASGHNGAVDKSHSTFQKH